MKRKLVDRSDWALILEKRYRLLRCDRPDFHGWIAEFNMIRVREPFSVSSMGTRVCIADAGFTWLHYLRDGANHVVTAMSDSSGATV